MKKFIQTWKIEILVGLLLAIEMVLNLLDASFQILSWFAIGLLIIRIVILKRELRNIKNHKPNIVVDGFHKEGPFHLFRNHKKKEAIERYYIMFRNRKTPDKTVCDTMPVHAIVKFYNKECEELTNLSHEAPFWLDSNPPWERPSDFKTIIGASSKPESLCLVSRQKEESDLYVFCDKSYIANIRDLQPCQPSLRLPRQDRCLAKIQLEAGNLDMEPIWISIKNLGYNQEPLFEMIEPPCS